MNPKKNSVTPEVLSLIEAIVLNDNSKGLYAFLRDLLTAEELQEFGNRWKVANMLDQKLPYVQIEAETSMSSTTIARISKWLKNGMGGYKSTIKRQTERKTQSSHRKTA